MRIDTNTGEVTADLDDIIERITALKGALRMEVRALLRHRADLDDVALVALRKVDEACRAITVLEKSNRFIGKRNGGK